MVDELCVGMAIRQIFGPDLLINLSATYVLKINILGVLYILLLRIEPDIKRYYIYNEDNDK